MAKAMSLDGEDGLLSMGTTGGSPYPIILCRSLH
jgi:hypothetical protein